MPRQTIPSTQNLVLYSEQFDNAAWIKEGTVSVTANQVANPVDGTVNADLFVNVSNTQGIYQRSITVPLGATYTRSVWLRCASGTMNVRAAGYFGTEFSATWAVTTTWQRFTASGIKTTGTTEVGFYLFNSDVGTLTNLYAWGAQITIANWEGAYATTTAAAVNTGNLRNRPVTVQNRLLYSEQFDNVVWGAADNNHIVSANSVVAPDGTLTADRWTYPASTGVFGYGAQSCLGLDASQNWTFSVWLKMASGSRAGNIQISNWSLTTLTSPSYTITTTWQKLSFTIQAGAMKRTDRVAVGFINFLSGNLIDVWGAQLTQANFASDYIVTAGAAVNTGAIRNRPETLQNLLLYSEQTDNGAYTGINVTITANTTTAPDGTATADTVTASGGGAVEHTTRQVTSPVVAGIVTGSCYVKYNNCQWVSLGSRNGTVEKRAWFDIQNGVKGTVNSGVTSTIESIGNGWYRISASWLSGTALGGSSDHCLAPVTGDGVSDVYTQAGQAVYVWGSQLVSANWAGPYVLTTSAAVNTGNIRNTAMNLQQNLSTNSASINTNAFSLINTSITVAGGTPPIGVTNCDFLKEDSAAGVHALNLNSQSNVTGLYYNFSLMAKSTNRRLQIYPDKGSGGNFLVNLMTGALISSNPGTDNTRNIQIKAIDGGFYRISFTYTSLYTGTNYHQVLLDNGSTNSYTGDNVSGASITGIQTTQASSMITYVETGATAINTGIPRALII